MMPYQISRRAGRALAAVVLLAIVTPATPAMAHWCDCLWDSRYNIVIRPVIDSIDVPAVGSATLDVWLQNNMGYPLSSYGLFAFANNFDIVRSVDSSSRTGSFVLPGERVRETLTITRAGVDDLISIDDISFYVRFGNVVSGVAQDRHYGSSNVTTKPSTVNPSADTSARRQAGTMFFGVSTLFLGDVNDNQGRHLRSGARVDFGNATERTNGISYLFNEYCVGRDSWSSGDGTPIGAPTACPTPDGPPDTVCASTSSRTGQTMTKYDWQHVWAAGELVYRWSVLSAVQRAALRDRLYCGSRDEVVAVRVFNVFLLGYLGMELADDGPFTSDVSGAAGADAQTFLTGLAAGTDAVGNAAKAALYMMGESTRQSDVESCLTSGDAFAEIVCASALNLRGRDDARSGHAADEWFTAEVLNRVSWTYNEGSTASEWVGLYAAHVANLVAWHYRGWQANAADAGIARFYREDAVAPRSPANLACSLSGSPPQLTLNWNAVTQDINNQAEPYYVGYRVYWGDASGNYVHTSYTTATSFAPPNLAPGGTYYLTVTAVDDSINASTQAPEVSCVAAAAADPPVAVIQCTPTSGDAPLSVTCTCTGSTDPNDNINHCYFRVGNTGVWQDGLSGGVVFDFTTPGSRTVNLRVTDDTGLETPAQQEIAVNDPNNDAPSADAVADVILGEPPLTVQFDGSGSSDPDGSIVAYAWDFDDGGTAATMSPSHTFTAEGIYDVMLTVTDDGTPPLPGEDSVRITVTASGTVNQAPVCANPTVLPASGAPPLPVSFDAQSCMDPDGDNLTIAWTITSAWNDQVDLTGPLAQHTFDAEGDFTVQLTVTDDGVPTRQLERFFDVQVGATDVVDPEGLAPLVAAGCGCRAATGSLAWLGAGVMLWLSRRRRLRR